MESGPSSRQRIAAPASDCLACFTRHCTAPQHVSAKARRTGRGIV